MANRNEKEASRKRILSTCVRLFLEQGFKHTPPKQILTEADVSAGTFYNLYRTKAGVLTELTEFMFQNQFTIAGQIAQGETDPVKLYAVETAIQLHIAELTEPLRELYVTAYTLPSTSAYLYRSTAKRLEGIFGDYLPDAEAKDFYEMEIASAGMMRSFMAVPCDVYFTVERKIARFLECALKLYNVPVERRREATAAVLQLDLHAMAAGIIRTTVQQAEKGFEAVKAEPAF